MNTEPSTLSSVDYLETIVYDKLIIPQAPAILNALCKIDSESADVIENLTSIVESNPVLERRFISLSNSALFRGVVSVNRVKTAIIRLGVTRVISLLIGLSLSQYIQDKSLPTVDRAFRQKWDFACYIACIAYVIAERKQIASPEKAMVAGLLHNIGFLSILLALEKNPFLERDPSLMESVIIEVMPILTPYSSRVTLEHWGIESDITSSIYSLGDRISCIQNYELSMLLKLAVTVGSSVECGVLNEAFLSREQRNIIHSYWPDIDTARDELIQYHPIILQLKEILMR